MQFLKTCGYGFDSGRGYVFFPLFFFKFFFHVIYFVLLYVCIDVVRLTPVASTVRRM